MKLWSIWDHETGHYYGAWEGRDGLEAVANLEEGSCLATNDVSRKWYTREALPDDYEVPMPRAPIGEMKVVKLGSFMVWSHKG